MGKAWGSPELQAVDLAVRSITQIDVDELRAALLTKYAGEANPANRRETNGEAFDVAQISSMLIRTPVTGYSKRRSVHKRSQRISTSSESQICFASSGCTRRSSSSHSLRRRAARIALQIGPLIALLIGFQNVWCSA